MTSGSLSSINRDMLSSFMLEDGNKLIYTGIDGSYSQIISDAFSSLIGDVNLAPQIGMLEESAINIINEANNVYGSNVPHNVQIIDLSNKIKELTDKIDSSIDSMLSSFDIMIDEEKLENMMPILGCIETIGILSNPHYEEKVDLRIIDAYRDALNKSSALSGSIAEIESQIEY